MITDKEVRKRIDFITERIKMLRNSLKEDSDLPVSSLKRKIDEIDQLERERGLYLGLLIT